MKKFSLGIAAAVAFLLAYTAMYLLAMSPVVVKAVVSVFGL
jgi:hypothetical protein